MGELSMVLTKEEVEDIKRRSDKFIPPYMRKWEENKRSNSPIIAEKVYQPR